MSDDFIRRMAGAIKDPKAQILVPKGPLHDNLIPQDKPSQPVCPNCKAKFAHDNAASRCSRCGLPDEIARLGPRMIARWRSKQGIRPRHPSTSNKRKKAHGRR